jgi:hypothetical protein
MNIVLCNQFKNESLRLKEWLLYNKCLGIKDFILIDDHSNDDSVEIINSIDGINVHILKSQTEVLHYENSKDTNNYAGMSNLAKNIITNFKMAHNYCLQKYGKNIYLGFFDVDEFIFYENYYCVNLVNLIERLMGDKPVLSLGSLEVNSDLFEVTGQWVTKQTTKAISFDNKKISSRSETVKSFQNLNYSDMSVFYKTPMNLYGHHIHYGGVNPHECAFAPLEECAFLHYRKPMYHPEINKKLCTQEYKLVKNISEKAYELL